MSVNEENDDDDDDDDDNNDDDADDHKPMMMKSDLPPGRPEHQERTNHSKQIIRLVCLIALSRKIVF